MPGGEHYTDQVSRVHRVKQVSQIVKEREKQEKEAADKKQAEAEAKALRQKMRQVLTAAGKVGKAKKKN